MLAGFCSCPAAGDRGRGAAGRRTQTVVVDPVLRRIVVEDKTVLSGTKRREIAFGEVSGISIGYQEEVELRADLLSRAEADERAGVSSVRTWALLSGSGQQVHGRDLAAATAGVHVGMKQILCYGDSNTWGATPPTTRGALSGRSAGPASCRGSWATTSTSWRRGSRAERRCTTTRCRRAGVGGS